MTHDSRVAESNLAATIDVPAFPLDHANDFSSTVETKPDPLTAIVRVAARTSDDNSAGYVSLLHVPASEAAHRLKAVLGESLFPKTPTRRGRPINENARFDAALAF